MSKNLLVNFAQSNCCLINFAHEEIVNINEWYKSNRDSIIYLTKEEFIAQEEEIQLAYKDKGAYAYMQLVIRKDKRFKVPTVVKNVHFEKVTLNSEYYQDAKYCAIENLHLHLQKEKEVKKLMKEAKELAKKIERKAIYMQDTAIIENHKYIRDFDSNYFVVETIENTVGEFYKNAIDIYNPTSVALTKRLFKKYTLEEVFQITLDSEAFTNATKYKFLYKSGKSLYAKIHEEKGVQTRRQNSKYNSNTITYLEIHTNDIINKLPEGAVEYINIQHGASGARRRSFLYAINDERIKSVLNKSSHGVYGNFEGKVCDTPTLVKNNVRVHTGIPTSITKDINCIALLTEVFGSGTREIAKTLENTEYANELKELKGTADGESMGDGTQNRTASLKTFAVYEREFTRKTLVNHLAKKYGKIEFIIGRTEEEDCKAQAVINDVFTNKENSPYWAKLLVFKKEGTNETPDLIGDMNAYKAPFDVKTAFKSVILEMPKEGRAKLSTQMASKILACAGFEGAQWMTKLLKDACLKVFTSKPEMFSLEDTKDMFLANIIDKVAPEAKEFNQSLKNASVKVKLNSVAKLINNFEATIEESANVRAIADIALMFDQVILGENEIFVPGAPVGVSCIIFRYPNIYTKEFHKATTISKKEIYARINELNCTSEIKKALKLAYADVEKGTAVFGGSKALMLLLGGQDFDFDLDVVIWLNDFTKLFKNHKPGVVLIKKGEAKSGESFIYGTDTMANVALAKAEEETDNVGGITNNYSLALNYGLTCIITKERFGAGFTTKMEKQMIKEFEIMLDYALFDYYNQDSKTRFSLPKITFKPTNTFGISPNFEEMGQKPLNRLNEEREGKYIPMSQIKGEDMWFDLLPIDQEDEDRLHNQLRNCKFETVDEMFSAIVDIARMARRHQELTIDSEKTSIYAEIVMRFTKYFGLWSKVEYIYTIDKNTNKVIRNTRKSANSVANALGRKHYVYDVFAQIRDNLEGYIMPKVQKLIDKPVNTDELKKQVGNFVGTKGYEAVYELSGFVYGGYVAATHDSMIADHKQFGKKLWKAINRSTRFVTGIDNDIELAKLATSVSLSKLEKGKFEYKKHKSSFDSNCFAKENALFYSEWFRKNLDVRERVYAPGVSNGTQLLFINGVSYDDNGTIIAVAKECINGEFFIDTFEEKQYACDDVMEHITFEESDETTLPLVIDRTDSLLSIEKGSKITISKMTGSRKEVVVDNEVCYCGMRYLVNAYLSEAKIAECTVEDVVTIKTTDENDNVTYKAFCLVSINNKQKEEAFEEDAFVGDCAPVSNTSVENDFDSTASFFVEEDDEEIQF